MVILLRGDARFDCLMRREEIAYFIERAKSGKHEWWYIFGEDFTAVIDTSEVVGIKFSDCDVKEESSGAHTVTPPLATDA